jgi:hypothetical protein
VHNSGFTVPFRPPRDFYSTSAGCAGPIIPAQESEARNSANKQEVAYISIRATSSVPFLTGAVLYTQVARRRRRTNEDARGRDRVNAGETQRVPQRGNARRRGSLRERRSLYYAKHVFALGFMGAVSPATIYDRRRTRWSVAFCAPRASG